MKELSLEEKARAYDEALEKARQLCAYPTTKPFMSDLQDLFPELAESEGVDEMIRKQLLKHLREVASGKSLELSSTDYERWATWVEKQGEHANFRNKIQIGDKVTRNEDGVLVNLSQLNRVAKKKVEQKPAWSEEDEKKLLCICAWIKDYPRIADFKDEMYTVANNYIDWLKSLKERYTWKPSDEQMTVFKMVFDWYNRNFPKFKALDSLYNDLNKLKEIKL